MEGGIRTQEEKFIAEEFSISVKMSRTKKTSSKTSG